jgi:hypothetical protein
LVLFQIAHKPAVFINHGENDIHFIGLYAHGRDISIVLRGLLLAAGGGGWRGCRLLRHGGNAGKRNTETQGLFEDHRVLLVSPIIVANWLPGLAQKAENITVWSEATRVWTSAASPTCAASGQHQEQ